MLQIKKLTEQEIRDEINTLANDYAEQRLAEENTNNSVLTKETIKAKAKEECLTELFMQDFGDTLLKAAELFVAEGKKYVESASWNRVMSEIENALNKINEISPEELATKTFHSILGLTKLTLLAFEKIALNKYLEKDFTASASLFCFLATLNSLDFTYWLRLGISYQEAGDYKSAVAAFNKALLINPNSIEGHLFAAECWIALGDKVKSVANQAKAKELISSQHLQTKWDSYLQALDKVIESHS